MTSHLQENGWHFLPISALLLLTSHELQAKYNQNHVCCFERYRIICRGLYWGMLSKYTDLIMARKRFFVCLFWILWAQALVKRQVLNISRNSKRCRKNWQTILSEFPRGRAMLGQNIECNYSFIYLFFN